MGVTVAQSGFEPLPVFGTGGMEPTRPRDPAGTAGASPVAGLYRADH